MIKIKKCTFCQCDEEDNNLSISTCEHFACSNCLYKVVVYSYKEVIKSTSPNDAIIMKCLFCEKGSYSLNNFKINEILKDKDNSSNKKRNRCGKCGEYESNNSVILSYCKDCRLHVCVTCSMTHPSDHIISNDLNQIEASNLCSNHNNRIKEGCCLTCSLEICFKCHLENHKSHEVICIEEFLKVKKEKLKSNLPYETYEDLDKDIDTEKQIIVEKLNNESVAPINYLEQLISKIMDIISHFKDRLNSVKDNLEISMENLKISFKKFYDDYKNIQSNDFLNGKIYGEFCEKKLEINLGKNFKEVYKELLSDLNLEIEDFKKKEILNNKIIDYKVPDFEKCYFNMFKVKIFEILELPDDSIVVWTDLGINVFKININNNSMEFIRTVEYDLNPYSIYSIVTSQNIICSNYDEILIWDMQFNLIQSMDYKEEITCIVSLPALSFAVGGCDENIKIFSKIKNSKKYKLHKELKFDTKQTQKYSINCLLYIAEHDFLLSSVNRTIKIFKLSKGEIITTLKDFDSEITSLIHLNGYLFVNSSENGLIKFWKFDCQNSSNIYGNDDELFDCVRILNLYDYVKPVFLNIFSEDYIISIQNNKFKLLDVKTFECARTFTEDENEQEQEYEDDLINKLIVTKNKSILTYTFKYQRPSLRYSFRCITPEPYEYNFKLNLWKYKINC